MIERQADQLILVMGFILLNYKSKLNYGLYGKRIRPFVMVGKMLKQL